MKKTSTTMTMTMIPTVCVLDGKSVYDANLAFLRHAEWPFIPYPSKVLGTGRMDPSGTGYTLPRGIALQACILHPRI